MSDLRIGYLVGSISTDSINRRLAAALQQLAPAGVRLVEIGIKDLPFYSLDAEQDFPAAARQFKQAITDADGILIVTPEYSRSIPGVLKNALDWAARPYGENAFAGQPVALAGTSPSPIGTATAQQHLRAILVHFDALVLGQPELFLQDTGAIANDGSVTDEQTRGLLEDFLETFAAFVRTQRAAADAPQALAS
ncbi:NAD(P)H-dependent oxidoreductase [Nakamurella flava]|uniref:NAD(P)H-dependent oxidoreductase n=1 Tax=Nakamurella flava TaxID=2576308 RepID=A0A4U6QEL7_9ACTN|nr:NADPH-dependent FMN reductase [Nakamurella flava]TKV58419.1 NAD(P)H-dependent oxidoreductase [Nakamurella flava]